MTATKVRHPAKFSEPILDALDGLVRDHLGKGARILDPFAGTGRVHTLRRAGAITTGIELEPEWATLHPATLVGNALALPFPAASFDAIVTSPAYGNRMADHHEARDASRRNTYRHALGRPLHPDNAGAIAFGPKYHELHAAAWAEALRVLRPGGLFVVNVSDFLRTVGPKGKRRRGRVEVVAWHAQALHELGAELTFRIPVQTRRQRQGANGDVRVDHEVILVLTKPQEATPCSTFATSSTSSAATSTSPEANGSTSSPPPGAPSPTRSSTTPPTSPASASTASSSPPPPATTSTASTAPAPTAPSASSSTRRRPRASATAPAGFVLLPGHAAWHLGALDDPDASICGLGPTLRTPRGRGVELVCARCQRSLRSWPDRIARQARRHARAYRRRLDGLGGAGQLTLVTDGRRYLPAEEVVELDLDLNPDLLVERIGQGIR